MAPNSPQSVNKRFEVRNSAGDSAEVYLYDVIGEWFGGVGASAMFLAEFVSYPWSHWDIAPMMWNKSGSPPYVNKGGTGFGVRALVELARRWQFQ